MALYVAEHEIHMPRVQDAALQYAAGEAVCGEIPPNRAQLACVSICRTPIMLVVRAKARSLRFKHRSPKRLQCFRRLQLQHRCSTTGSGTGAETDMPQLDGYAAEWLGHDGLLFRLVENLNSRIDQGMPSVSSPLFRTG